MTDQLVQLCSHYDYIAVCGFTRSGKSIIAKEIAERINYQYSPTDDYLEFDFVEQAGMIISDIGPKSVLCGMQTPRVLRKGLREGTYAADLVIWVECDSDTLIYAYEQAGDEDNIEKMLQFSLGMLTVYQEWEAETDAKIIEINTSVELD